MIDLTDAGLLSPVRAGTDIEAVVSDRAWLQAMLDAEAGLARAQASLGLIPAAAAESISRVALADGFDIVAVARRAREAANPVIAMVQELTAAVRDIDPDAAPYVHFGSTSQDIVDTAAMLVATRALRVILGDLDATVRSLTELARQYRDVPAVGRTLTQHAVPVTFGLRAVGWLDLVGAAAGRVRERLETGLPVQLGGAAGTLAGYLEHAVLRGLIDSEPARVAAFVDDLFAAFARELGLAEPTLPWHAARVPLLELGGLLSLVTGALGKFGLDVQTLSQTEVGEVVEPAVTGRGASSAMPHKRNPVLATLIHSAALQVPAYSTVLTQAMLARDERPPGAWQSEWPPLRECLRLAGGSARTAAELAAGLEPQPTRMWDNLLMTEGLVITERVAAVLTARMGRARAKDAMTRVSAVAHRQGRTLRTVIDEDPEISGALFGVDLEDLFDPARYTGAAGALVDRALRRQGAAAPAE